jgi:hypothetical protein
VITDVFRNFVVKTAKLWTGFIEYGSGSSISSESRSGSGSKSNPESGSRVLMTKN